MFRVEEIVLVDADGAWAVALRPGTPADKLERDMTLVAGMRRWRVAEVHEAPAGLAACRLEGPSQVTRGLVVRSSREPMGDAEYKAACVFLVRVARGCRRAVDLEGLLASIGSRRAAGAAGNETRAVAKTAILVRHLVDSGATEEELDEAAAALGLEGEV